MPNALDKEELLRQNLIDAGCDEKLTEEGLKHFRNGTLPEFLTKLKAHTASRCFRTSEKVRNK